jgi:citrate lyase beta subunit
MADTTIPDRNFTTFLLALDRGNVRIATRFHGESLKRQPVHTFNGGAHLFKSDTVPKLGAVALRTLQEYAPDPHTFADAIGYPRDLAERIYPRMVDKLSHEPIEDFRIDFEEGFGERADEVEDHFAQRAAEEVAAAFAAHALPIGIGIRIKPLSVEHKRRSLRTFDLFLTRLLDRTGNVLPSNFVVTLPKITSPEHVAALVAACQAFEYWRGLPAASLRIEVMVETTQAIVAEDGRIALPRLIEEGNGRIVTAHFGTYDYTAACGIIAPHQHMLHPVCDFAKHVMQVALAGTGVWIADGATNILPVGPHSASDAPLTPTQLDENRRAVHRAWRLHAEHVRHSHFGGFYQGWDLHPAQLPTRYAAVYAFFGESLDAASEGLRNILRRAATATLADEMRDDDAATGQGLLNRFERAMNCGAITKEEAVGMTGLTLAELHTKSFAKLLANRRSLSSAAVQSGPIAEPQKCVHPSCECRVVRDGPHWPHCSEHCKEAADMTELRCDCQHPECRKPNLMGAR